MTYEEWEGGWYFRARYILGDHVYQNRLSLLTRVIQLLLKMVPQQRGGVLRPFHSLPNQPETPGIRSNRSITVYPVCRQLDACRLTFDI